MQTAEKLGYEVIERSVDRTELYTADEAFLCGSAMEVTPVLSVDRNVIGEGKTGEITERLHRTYLDIALNRSDLFKEWVSPIY